MAPYRPSNGTEGDLFMEAFCASCTRDGAERPCGILLMAFALDLDHPDYPQEWQRDERGARCTAFTTEHPPPPLRCTVTADLFGADAIPTNG